MKALGPAALTSLANAARLRSLEVPVHSATELSALVTATRSMPGLELLQVRVAPEMELPDVRKRFAHLRPEQTKVTILRSH